MPSSDDLSERTALFFTLFIKCPFREATAACPFAEIRALPDIELKFQQAEKLAANARYTENLLNTHASCYQNRMRRIMNRQKELFAPGTTETRLIQPNTAGI